MKKTELIKNAINARVIVTLQYDNTDHRGWLVIEPQRKNHYLLLPFTELKPTFIDDVVWSFRVSHIKHLTYINNGYRLW